MFRQRRKKESETLYQERDKYIPKEKTSNTVYHSRLLTMKNLLVVSVSIDNGRIKKKRKGKYLLRNNSIFLYCYYYITVKQHSNSVYKFYPFTCWLTNKRQNE